MRKAVVSVAAIAAGAALPLAVVAFRGAEEPAPRISLQEFQGLYSSGAVVLLDVRDPKAYAAGHVRGAVSIPLGDLGRRLRDLRAVSQPIVTYCRCPDETTSLTAARRLAAQGIDGVRALEGGYDAWVAAGGSVDQSPGDDAP